MPTPLQDYGLIERKRLEQGYLASILGHGLGTRPSPCEGLILRLP